MAVGICAVTLLTSIGQGVRLHLLDSFSQFGTRIVTVTPGRSETMGGSGLLSTIRPLSLADAASLRTLAHVEAVVPMIAGTSKIEAGRFQRDTDVYAVGSDLPLAWHFRVAQGRPAGRRTARFATTLCSVRAFVRSCFRDAARWVPSFASAAVASRSWMMESKEAPARFHLTTRSTSRPISGRRCSIATG